MEITFTFAIVNWNTKDLLDACLASILQVQGSFNIQILVADNNSSDGSTEMVSKKYPEVELVRNSDNLGFAKGHETLFPLSKGVYHVLTNSDVRFKPGCLEVLHSRMEKDPEIGVLGCQILGNNDSIQPSCRRFPSLLHQFIDATGLNRLFPKHRFLNAYKMGDFDHQTSREVDQVMGSLFLIRRQVVEKVGILDTSFFMYYEEVDYCLRVKKAGYKVFFDADARVFHEGGGSSKKVKTQTIRRTMRSMRHYFRKHGGSWTWFPLLFILMLDLVTHAIFSALKRTGFMQTLKAYALAWWDVATWKRADL